MPTLAIIPTRKEVDAFLAALRGRGHCHERLTRGRLALDFFPDLGLSLTLGGLGKVQFAVHTQHLIEQASWDLVICAGAGGALSDELHLGDVVVATETVEHDMRNRFGPLQIPRFPASPDVLDRLKRHTRPDLGFGLFFGPIASGDEDVVELERRSEIRARTGALAVAWEGAGGARAARFSDVPYVEIRGISDGANETAAADFKGNLPTTMVNVARVVEFALA